MTFEVPAQGRWTVDDMAIFPEKFRYELVDGVIDFQDRAPLTWLAGVAVMGALKDGCPPGLRVVPWAPILPAPPTIAVLGGDGAVLVVDVVQADWSFIDLHARTRLFAALRVPQYWAVEPMGWRELVLTVFGGPDDDGYVVESSTRDVFRTDDPYPVTVDLPSMARRWPVVSEFHRW
ncbi:hypothetical protein [Actinoplanes sp. G11-F43]|uniref:hypothetical protein n=1 Tax=Actinoplanes sp. G11-F43 TaxID=3424130 RepID=UPI003D343604